MKRGLVFLPPLFVLFLACSSADVPIGELGGSCSSAEACFRVEPGGGCSLDPGATCAGGTWQCPAGSTLAAGCSPDGGVIPVPEPDSGAPPVGPDGSTAPLDSSAPSDAAAVKCNPAAIVSISCTSQTQCTPFGMTCEYNALVGDGVCVCVVPADDAGSGVSDASPDDGGKPCVATTDCPTAGPTQVPWICSYPIADQCSATGVCLPSAGLCDSVTPAACACDGTNTPYGNCSGYPAGYAGKPVETLTACGADAATICASGTSFPTAIACSGPSDDNPICAPYQARCVGGFCTCGP